VGAAWSLSLLATMRGERANNVGANDMSGKGDYSKGGDP